MASSVTRWLPHDEHRGPPRAACWVSEPRGTGACATREERGERRVRGGFAGAWTSAASAGAVGSVATRLLVRGMLMLRPGEVPVTGDPTAIGTKGRST